MITKAYPPGPKGHWLSGNLPEFRQGRLAFFTRCAREFGDVAALRFGPRRIFLLSHPDLIEDVLVTQNQNFIKHFALRLNPLLLGNGLLTSEGKFWLRQRRLVQPAFNRSRLAAYAPAMVQASLRLMENWRPGERRDMHAEFMRLTLDIAAKTLFNSEAVQDASEVAEAMRVMQETFSARFTGLLPLPLWLPTPNNLRMRRAVRRLDKLVYGFIRQRRGQATAAHVAANGSATGAAGAAQPFEDLLSLLLHAQDEDDGGRMSDQQVRDEAMTLFLAGHETTALALSWTWYLLSRHPKVQDQVLQEIDAVLPGRLPVLDDVAKLRYLEAVVLEAMRLYPPAYVIGREALRDTEVGDYPVRRGTTVLMSQWVVHRDPRFFPDPESFRPERWQGDEAKKTPKFAYFPFGGGPRLCVGNTFALVEMALVLATLLSRFRCALEDGVAVNHLANFTLHPSPGIPGVIVPRAPG